MYQPDYDGRVADEGLAAERASLRAQFPFEGQPFEDAALKVFRYQARANPVYGRWLILLRRSPETIERLADIPFLPIQFFKTQTVWCLPGRSASQIFCSSRTTGQVPSRHLVHDLGLYTESARLGFERVFGPLSGCYFISLLPSYSQTGESSLVHMVHGFAQAAGQREGAHRIEPTIADLEIALAAAQVQGKQPALFGVTHALLALAKAGSLSTPFLLIETGGMKGRGPELTRAELHLRLQEAFLAADIRSEYGMTELLSQGYTQASGSESFVFPPWVQATLRDVYEPLAPSQRGRGGLNLIDLANLDSCAFIATEDQAEATESGFRILGRLDQAEIRGCNLLSL